MLVLLVAVVVAADQIISRKLRHVEVRLGCHKRWAMYRSEFSFLILILIPNVCFALLGLRLSPSRFISATVRCPVVRPLALMVPPFPHIHNIHKRDTTIYSRETRWLERLLYSCCTIFMIFPVFALFAFFSRSFYHFWIYLIFNMVSLKIICLCIISSTFSPIENCTENDSN